MVENVPESLEIQPAVLSSLLAPVYHIHSLLVVVSEGRVHVFCPFTRQSLYITVLYIIAVGSQKAGWSFSLSSLMSEVSSKVARNGSPASRGHVHPLITQILCSQCSHQWCRWQTPWAHSISSLCHSVQTNLSRLEKLQEHFLHREREKRPMNVIFYLLFSVGWCWNFCFWHALVNQSCQDTSYFGFSLQLPLVPPVLTADVPQWF